MRLADLQNQSAFTRVSRGGQAFGAMVGAGVWITSEVALNGGFS